MLNLATLVEKPEKKKPSWYDPYAPGPRADPAVPAGVRLPSWPTRSTRILGTGTRPERSNSPAVNRPL